MDNQSSGVGDSAQANDEEGMQLHQKEKRALDCLKKLKQKKGKTLVQLVCEIILRLKQRCCRRPNVSRVLTAEGKSGGEVVKPDRGEDKHLEVMTGEERGARSKTRILMAP